MFVTEFVFLFSLLICLPFLRKNRSPSLFSLTVLGCSWLMRFWVLYFLTEIQCWLWTFSKTRGRYASLHCSPWREASSCSGEHWWILQYFSDLPRMYLVCLEEKYWKRLKRGNFIYVLFSIVSRNCETGLILLDIQLV